MVGVHVQHFEHAQGILMKVQARVGDGSEEDDLARVGMAIAQRRELQQCGKGLALLEPMGSQKQASRIMLGLETEKRLDPAFDLGQGSARLDGLRQTLGNLMGSAIRAASHAVQLNGAEKQRRQDPPGREGSQPKEPARGGDCAQDRPDPTRWPRRRD